MAINNSMDLFVLMLSNFRQSVDRATKICQEMEQLVSEPRIKDAMMARNFITQKTLATVDEVFKMIGKQPSQQQASKIHDVLLEDFRREVAELQTPEVKRLFVLSKISRLIHFHIGELVALVAAADLTGKYGVGVLLESILADKLAFAERTRRFIRKGIEAKIVEKAAA